MGRPSGSRSGRQHRDKPGAGLGAGAATDGPCDVLLSPTARSTASPRLIQTARAGRQRIFVVGIGPAVPERCCASWRCRSAAPAKFVTRSGAVGGAMQRLFARLREPGYTGLGAAALPADAGTNRSGPQHRRTSVSQRDLVPRLWLERLPAGATSCSGPAERWPRSGGRARAGAAAGEHARRGWGEAAAHAGRGRAGAGGARPGAPGGARRCSGGVLATRHDVFRHALRWARRQDVPRC